MWVAGALTLACRCGACRAKFNFKNELPRRKQRGIEHPNLNSFRGKPRGIEPEEIKFHQALLD
jgi:hypothetical protein